MGTKVEDIVVVNITRATARVTQTGFGEFLFLTGVSQFSDRSKRYTEPADLLDDGFLATDEAYLAALIAFSQAKSPESFKIGRKLENVNAKQLIVFDADPDAGDFKIVFDGQTTAAIAYNANAAAIKAALELLSNINEVTVTGSIGTSGFYIEWTGADGNASKATVTITANTLTVSSVAVSETITVDQYGSAVESWTDALNAVLAFDEDWYMLTASTYTKSEIKELAAIIETKLKMYAYRTQDSDTLTSATDDVASELKALNYDRTFGFYTSDESKYPEMAVVGLQLPKKAGSSNWALQEIAGVTSESLNSTQASYLASKRLNVIETIGGLIITSPAIGEGKVASGEYIDIIRGTDWLQTRIAERIVSKLVQEEKIPFTNEGGAVLESELRAQLDEASGNDYKLIVASTIVVTNPDVSEISAADKSNRIWGDIEFSADYQGAVNKVTINGKLSF